MKLNVKQVLALSATALMVTGTAAQANDIKFKSSGGLKWETEDGKASGQLGGRLMLDASYFDEDVVDTHENGLHFRRLRLETKAQYLDWGLALQLDFSAAENDNNEDDVALKDAYIYKKAFGGKLIAGQYKQPFGLEELTSSKYITFMERSFAGIPKSHSLGFAYTTSTDQTSFTISGYDPDSMGDGGGTDNDGVGVGGRFTFAPHVGSGNVTHFGIAAAQEANMNRYRVRPRIGHQATRTVILDVADNNEVDVTKVGLEAALVRGPFSLQGEYQRADVQSSVADEAVNAYYIYASYFLTGETRPYKASSGSFDRVKPLNESGAWEIALRYEGAENDDTDGEAQALTAGLNYYVNPYVRCMFNVVRGDLTNSAGTTTDKPTALLARVQLDF